MFIFQSCVGLPFLYMCPIVPLGFLLHEERDYGYESVYVVSKYCSCYDKLLSQIMHPSSCWIRYTTNFIWSFIAPVIVIILVGYNIINTYTFLSLFIPSSLDNTHWRKCPIFTPSICKTVKNKCIQYFL